MKRVPAVLVAVAAGCCFAALAAGQAVISARSGTIHYLEGQAFLDDKAVEMKFGQFPEIGRQQVFRTEEGRAEILLTPGVFLRVGENSAIRMISNPLSDTRVALLRGSALIECAEIMKGTAVSFTVGDIEIPFQKRGLFRLDAEPPLLRVYSGEAAVIAGGVSTAVKDGRQVELNAALLVPAKFDKNDADALYRWAKRRAESLAVANIAAARRAARSGGGSLLNSGWMWNPYFGMITYVPWRGSYYSPFGYRFWSPGSVYQVFERPSPSLGGGSGMPSAASSSAPSYNPSYGYTTAERSAGSYSVAAPAASSAPASSAPAPSAPARTSDSGGGRGTVGGPR
jgi:hypothetical protein